jgi:hypothetical protein
VKAKPKPLDQPCHAVATFYGEAPRHAMYAMRGSCQWQARYLRDGKPVCGVHLRAKQVEFYDPTWYLPEAKPENLWPKWKP